MLQIANTANMLTGPRMSAEKYLKDKQYYIDLYDKFTVNECRRIELEREKTDKTDRKNAPWKRLVYDVKLYFIKGERYLEKQKTIEQWMQEDKTKDERFENAELYINVHCPNCKSPMEFENKHFRGLNDEHILFIYRCKSCGKRRGFLEDESEYIPETPRCPKCKKELNETIKRGKKEITFVSSCKHCNYHDSWNTGDRIKKPEIDHNFAKDRQKFCLSEKEGKEYYDSKCKLESVSSLIEDFKEKEENKELYDQLASLEKLTVAQMQNFLTKELKKCNYTALMFSKPKMDKHVTVDFTVQDNKSDRSEYDSEMELKKTINKALHNTNWRLMTNGPFYRLGILSGQLKGLENEKDLLDKIRYRKPLPK